MGELGQPRRDTRDQSWTRFRDALERFCEERGLSFEDGLDAATSLLRRDPPPEERLELKELRHRVRNELHVLMSMMRLRSRSGADAERWSHCTACIGQTASIARVHDVLERPTSGRTRDVGPMLAELAAAFREAFALDSRVRIEVDADCVEAPPGVAEVVGLILNETLTNAMKHALRGGAGRIAVTLRRLDDRRALLSVSDPGPGCDEVPAAGSGLHLIDALASRIGARVERTRSNGGFRLTCIFEAGEQNRPGRPGADRLERAPQAFGA